MFYFDDFYGKKILKSTLLKDYDCFFTTRDFPLMNLSSDDDWKKEEAEQNRGFLEKKLNSKITSAKQVHGDNIEIIRSRKNYYEDTDALISDIPNSLIALYFADCVPIILYSRKDNTGAVIHAGWRGSVKQIAEKTVEKMRKEKNVNPENLTALIGPAIGQCCFETGEEIYNEFIKIDKDERIYKKKLNKYYIDLKLFNLNRLAEAGVKNTDVCGYCTCCMSGIFFSYRKKDITARHSAVVKIKEEKICL